MARCARFLIERFDRLAWPVCRACRVEFAIDEVECQEQGH